MKLERLLTHEDPSLRKLAKAVYSADPTAQVEHVFVGQKNYWPFLKLVISQKRFYVQFQYSMVIRQIMREYDCEMKWFVEIIPKEIKHKNKTIQKYFYCIDQVLKCYSEAISS